MDLDKFPVLITDCNVRIRPENPQDDVMAKAIGAGLRQWAANNYASSGEKPTPSAPNAPSSSDEPQNP
jgi:hypothetical protein